MWCSQWWKHRYVFDWPLLLLGTMALAQLIALKRRGAQDDRRGAQDDKRGAQDDTRGPHMVGLRC